MKRNYYDRSRPFLGRAIWRLYRAYCTALLRLTPPTSAQRDSIRKLKARIASLPPIQDEDDAPSAHPIWVAARKRLRELILSRDPRGFLTWDIVAETMFIRYGAFVRAELKLLRGDDWRTKWRNALQQPRLGLPFGNTNTIHHAYHLCRFELETFSRISDYAVIFEFGGGYGSLCRLCHAVGFTGKYILFDFPEQSALQRYYLSSIGLSRVAILSEIDSLTAELKLGPQGPRLFIATWSLSESALALRKQIAQIVHSFDAFLIAYQEEFPGIDNCAYFQEWQASFPNVTWKESTIAHLPGNRYLFGTHRKRC